MLKRLLDVDPCENLRQEENCVGITIPKTKIVCTIGPVSEAPEVIRGLISNGMRVARLNFSHGTHHGHEEKIRIIRKISADLGKPVAILQDLGGPKIRVCGPYP